MQDHNNNNPKQSQQHHPWNPGLGTDLPRHLYNLETIYHPANTLTQLSDLTELAKLTGIKTERLVEFKPDRLLLHELIVRITAHVMIPETEDEELLGKRFRAIVRHVMANYIEPEKQRIFARFADYQLGVARQVEQHLQQAIFNSPAKPQAARGLWQRLFVSKASTRSAPVDVGAREFAAIKSFKQQGMAADDAYQQALFKSLYVVLSAIGTTHGRLIRDPDLLKRLVCRQMDNDYGSQFIGQQLAPLIDQAIAEEGYRRVETADKPMLISLKGASAAGKSTMRPYLRALLQDHGARDLNYCTISPDIWRRLILTYETLGPDYKYAGRLTSNEVSIIDRKLDTYIRQQAQSNQSIPHIMVDRFRFDSFNAKQVGKILAGTYAQHVHTMHMYFVITPPEETVVRGWYRGLERGRYKAIEDFLGHSVEAYWGMPRLFFKWLANKTPLYQYQFVDNAVPKGETPKMVAWGDQQDMHIVDPINLVNIERYQKINIYAQQPDQVYPQNDDMVLTANCGFLQQCLDKLPQVHFYLPNNEHAYMSYEQGKLTVHHADQLLQALHNNDLKQVFGLLFSKQLADWINQ